MPTYVVKTIVNNHPNRFQLLKRKVKNLLNRHFSDILYFPKNTFKGQLPDDFYLDLHSDLVDFKNFKLSLSDDNLVKFIYQASLYSKGNKALIDIGVNYGIFSICLANYFDKIYSFEASKILFNKIQSSIKINDLKNIYLFNNAVSNRVGENVFFDSDFAYGGAKIISNKKSNKKTERVKTTTIDNEVTETFDAVFFKVDVEGAEYQVMEGFKKCLERHKNKKIYGVIEFNNSHLSNDFGVDPYKFFSYLKESFYMIASFPYSTYFYDMSRFSYTDLLHSYYMFRPAGPNLHLNFLISNSKDIYSIAEKISPVKELVIDQSKLLEKKEN